MSLMWAVEMAGFPVIVATRYMGSDEAGHICV
jgi:hypothetical protein